MKKLLITILFVTAFMGIKTTHAAIALDATSTKIVNGFFASPTNTWTSNTTAAGATLGILTCDIVQDLAPTGTVGSATYNGSTITEATSTLTGGMYSYIGYITSPVSGAKTVSVVVSGNIDSFKCSFSTFTGTSVSSPLDVKTNTGLGSAPYTSVGGSLTTGQAGELVISTVSKFNTGTLTPSGTQSGIFRDFTGSISGVAGYEVVSGVSTVTHSWSVASASDDWSDVMASFKPATVATVAPVNDINNFITFN